MPLSLIFLPLIAQIGPSGTQMGAPLDLPRRKPASTVLRPAQPAPRVSSRFEECLDQARNAPAAAVDNARAWRDTAAKGAPRAAPEQCLGLALSGQGDWSGAEQAFLAARDDSPADDRRDRARLGTLAANAALAAGANERALGLLDAAHGEALGGGDPHLAAEIAIDRARALAAMKRDNEAAAALAEATTGAPENATGWLLAATLARRQGKLPQAQTAIEHAALLQPLDPETGLEAGVIAVLAGRDAAARRSWQSVIAAAPGSDSAKTAQQYLDQLGPQVAPSGR
ncbi:MAG: hypothetical protein JSR96_07670 [Proteobacteria bacterium]|nr:hypothetical protein [Pseudomonadota bacterium]